METRKGYPNSIRENGQRKTRGGSHEHKTNGRGKGRHGEYAVGITNDRNLLKRRFVPKEIKVKEYVPMGQ